MALEEPRTVATERRLTRGKVLKRAGIGAAAVWTIPLVATTTAEASNHGRCLKQAETIGVGCVSACLQDPPRCSGDQFCACVITTKGCCACLDRTNLSCDGSPACRKDKECPRGWKCAQTTPCCTGAVGRCLPPCTGSPPPAEP